MIPLEDTVLLAVTAGEIMLKNGAETKRVEDTMEHIARACGAAEVECFAIPTGVFLTVCSESGCSLTTMRRVHKRNINLDRIDKVNELSRRLEGHRTDYRHAMALLERIGRERTGFFLFPSMVASGLVGGTTAVILDAAAGEMFGAFVAACLIRYVAHVISNRQGVHLTFEFLGGMTVALIGAGMSALFPSVSRDMIVIGGIMPMVPGMAITNAIGDFIAGDLLSGLSRAMEAALTAAAVAMGVFLVLAASLWQT